MSAFGHHHGVNAKDTFFPLRHEHFFFKQIHWPEIFQTAEVMCESHNTLQLRNRLSDVAAIAVVHAFEKAVLQRLAIEMATDEHESALA